MDKNKVNVPKIRFPGFTDPWKQRKLNECIETSNEKNSDDVYNKDNVLSVSGDFGIVNQIEFQGRSFAGESVSKYGVVNTGSIVYTKSPLKRNPFGIIKTNKGKSGIVSTLYAVYKPKENTNPNFVQCYFELDYRVNNYLKPLVNKGAKNDMKVSDDNALLGLIIFPSYEEQTQISVFFETLDNLITLHQRKLEHLQDKKKVLLQKMFPKEGEKFPGLRFPGFTDHWEQRKLGEILYFLKDGTHGTHQDVEDGPLLLSAKNIKNGKIHWDSGDRRIAKSEYEKIHSNFTLEKEDILLTIVGSIGETAILKDNSGITFQRSVAYLRPKADINSDFLYSEIQSPKFQKELMNRKSTSAQPGIYLGDLSVIPVSYPRNLEEQKQIGITFVSLDKLINLHQRKLEHLQQQKKGLLQQMFI